jgi:hypothetical protein
MKVALGFKSHSGWAAMVIVGVAGNGFEVVDRRRIELTDEGETWAKQPYHAAENLEAEEANRVVASGIESARRVAIRQMREVVSVLNRSGHKFAGCGVVVPEPMPNWTTGEILAVHFRMHKAEGVLFPDSLCLAARECKLPLAAVPEKKLAEANPEISPNAIAALGKSIGPPWGKDQKCAAMAAIVALRKI